MSIVNKDQTRVRILMGNWDIECEFHSLPGSRLTDAINAKGGNTDFIAVTSVTVRDAVSSKELFKTPFMNLNRLSIMAIYPLDDADGQEQKDVESTVRGASYGQLG